MRILQIGDTHLGMQDGMIGAPRGVTRASDHLAAFDAALAPAMNEDVDLVVHTGDLFNRSLPPRRAVIQMADRLTRVARRVPTVVIAGNHDRRGLVRYLPHRLPGLSVVDRPEVVRAAGLRIAALPFVRRAEDWAIAAKDLCRDGVDFLIAHQAFDGDRVPGFSFRVDRQRDTIGERHIPRGLRWILSGHLHPRQVVPVGECTVVHGGSTERTAFSEADQLKGTVVWSWSRSVTHAFVDGPTRPMLRVRGEPDLERIRPGSWVLVDRELPAELDRVVLERGGFLRPRRQPRADSTAETSEASSGVTVGSNRASTSPSRPTRNLPKFQAMSLPLPGSEWTSQR